MFISVMFKDKNKVFGGKAYDFKVDNPPKIGSIIRMYSKDGAKPVCNATRVMVIGVKSFSNVTSTQEISYVETTLDD